MAGRVLCFGGSFNPIHNGHLICARAVAEQGGFERVSLIPTPNPPHKQHLSDIADAGHRLDMCRRAIEGDNFFDIDGIELELPAPSYTIQTARELKRRGSGEVNWLIGADMLHLLPKWHKVESLLREVRFVVMRRPGFEIDWQSMPPAFHGLADYTIEAPLIQISSTDVRRRLAAGRSIRYLVPEAVEAYIRQHRLYGG